MSMRKRVRIGRRKQIEEPEIIVIPMIDVMMFLLFFFMVASLAMAVTNSVPVSLPKASTGQDDLAQNVTITIDAAGNFYVGTAKVGVDQIESKLEALHVSPKNVVTINADDHVTHGKVISAMDEARKAGVVMFGFATNRK